MPEAEELKSSFTDYVAPLAQQQEVVPTWSEIGLAAIYQENDLYNLYDYATTKMPPIDFKFNLKDELNANNMWEVRDDYLGVMSKAEFDQRKNKIAEEEQNRSILAASGWTGFTAQMASGAVSPTAFIPFIKGATLAKSVIKGAFSVAAGAAAQEAVLFANQQTRTSEEGAASVGASMVLGGILGGAASALTKSEFKTMASSMANDLGQPAISKLFDNSSNLSAASVSMDDAGKLVYAPGNKLLSKLNAVTRGIEQSHAPDIVKRSGGSALIRQITSQFSQAGLLLEGNKLGKTTAEAGNVENIVATYAARSYEAAKALDDAYKNYIFDGAPPSLAGKTRAVVSGMMDKTKLSVSDFNTEVSRAIWNDFDHPNPHVVKAAKTIDKEVFQTLYDEAVEVGIFTGKENTLGDKRYLSHLWDRRKVESGFGRLVTILSDHYEQKLNNDFAKQLDKTLEKQTKAQTFVNDLQRPADEVNKLVENFKKQLSDNEENLPFDLAQIDLEAKNNLSRARTAQGDEKQKFLIKARKAVTEGGKDLADYKKNQAALRSRISTLNSAGVKYEEKLNKIVLTATQNEDAQLETLFRAAKSAKKFLDFLAKGSNKEFEKAIEKFKNEFSRVAEIYDRAEEKLLKLSADKETDTLLAQEIRVGKLDELAQKIEELETFDRSEWQSTVENTAKEMLSKYNETLKNKTLREQKLAARAAKLSPKEFELKLEAAKNKAAKILPDFNTKMQTQGANGIDYAAKKADFKEFALDKATETAHKLKGSERRLPYSDLIQDRRGIELARVLDIPAEKVMDFLQTDIEKISNTYIRTLAADITLKRAFGSTNLEEQFIKLTDEETKVQLALLKEVDKNGKAFSAKEQTKKAAEISKFYNDARKDIEVLLERTRGTRGVPTDPDAWSARAAKSVMELNVIRLLGGTVAASIADIGKTVIKYGLTSSMKDGYLPLVTNFKTFKMSAGEAHAAGVAVDYLQGSRTQAINDIFDDAYRGTVLERGITYLSRKSGAITLMDQWNTALQQFSAGVINANLIRDIFNVVEKKASFKAFNKSVTRLASLNISGETAEMIWEQLTKAGGGEKINGIWLPNTENWDVTTVRGKTARRAYRAALAGSVNNTIVKPGLERPNWTDATLPGRLVAQFRSFSLSSTQKTLMAGMQAHDMAFFNGVMISLAFGSLSYYLWAVAAGGKAYEEMQNAGLDKWADEAISRSGVTAIFDEAQRTAARIPLIGKYATFSGRGTSKREGGGLLDAVTGPSLGLARTATNVITEIAQRDEQGNLTGPDRHVVHLIRTMLPFQNLFYFRQLLDKVENKIGDVAELKGKPL